MKRFIALIMTVAACVILYGPNSVKALDCAEPAPVADELARSSVAFVGQALAVNKEGLTVFQVQTAWKGVAESRIEVYDNGWDSYAPGQTYLVFGGEGEGKLRTNLCGRSGLWDASKELAIKEAGIQPISITSEASEIDQRAAPSSNSSAPIVVAVTVIVVLAGSITVLWLIRRRQRR